MSLTTNSNRRQSLREIANRALADYIANGSSVQTVASSKKKVETFRSAASVASQGRKLNTLRNAGFASR
jgi:hypothetical protein